MFYGKKAVKSVRAKQNAACNSKAIKCKVELLSYYFDSAYHGGTLSTQVTLGGYYVLSAGLGLLTPAAVVVFRDKLW